MCLLIDRTLCLVNRFCLWLGFTICFGLSLIGNFQLESPLPDASMTQPIADISLRTEGNKTTPL